MKFHPTLMLTATAAASLTSAANFTSCSNSTSALQISQITLSPDPIVPGQDACVTVSGNLSQAITVGSNVHLTASLWGFQFVNTTTDLCNILAYGTTPCPIPANSTSLTECFKVPDNVPTSITFDVRAEATAQDGSELFCAQGPLSFGGNA
ncbi:Phosphatidylglycerol/phosphatidylinositol transfer protein [Mortierella claussenii]|nr:Phosphatidylglycerol/phosphatidylinositol transfer protein [Mortierella claussenii]